jgi:DNA-binding XRE family transcriptional regulator
MVTMVRNNIGLYRKKYKISQIELAKELNVTRQYISKIEKGESDLGLEVCFKIINAFIRITEKKSKGRQVANLKIDDLFYQVED